MREGYLKAWLFSFLPTDECCYGTSQIWGKKNDKNSYSNNEMIPGEENFIPKTKILIVIWVTISVWRKK